ncbi:hypothetical protein NKI79_12365 [Mesorhizobium sp. M0340]|uniref:helix-turn-helix transcriptional regulator n=1 Tax=Mesorhizobium sp. M0340 TaxID=2956939 RepID=UPI00333A3AD8
MKSTLGVLTPPLFGINREQAAGAIGVSPTTFDQMVADGRMPQPRMPSKERYVWDVEELAEAFRRLPHRNSRLDGESLSDNPWDRK